MDKIIIPSNIEDAISLYNNAAPEEGGLVLISICDTGGYSIYINNRRFHVGTQDILIVPHGESIGKIRLDSKDTDINFVCISSSIFLNNIRSGRNAWGILMYTKNNPVFTLSKSDRALTSSYLQVVKGKLATPRGFYYDEILKSLLQCVIFELCVIISRDLTTSEDNPFEKRKDLIFKKFIELLSESDGCRRSVRSYADELCISSKYLSAVTIDICGKNAHELILNNVVSRIKSELDFSDKSIKELSSQFGFPNLSAFGNFVKTRLGVSPREYRNGKKSRIQ